MEHSLYQEFITLLNQENKDASVAFVLSLLEKKLATLDEIYDQLLRPALVGFTCTEEDEAICIWKEHLRSSIIRTILEVTYPFVMEQKRNVPHLNKKVIVVCPKEEFHEIGAIIVTHYLNLVGFDATFIGANTPNDQIIKAIPAFKPDYIALSVTNFYNVVATKFVTEHIYTNYPDVKIIIGGQAFHEESSKKTVKYHYYFQSTSDIFELAKEVANETSTTNRN